MIKKLPEWIKSAQAKWKHRGQEKPSFAIEPHAGQESVWDYPRPPRIIPDTRHVVVRTGDRIIAESNSTYRILETASPPTFYIPPHDVDLHSLVLRATASMCEWKGIAQYWSLENPDHILEDIAWSYPAPYPGFEKIAGYLSFYPGRIACFVDEERVQPQPGGLYGGWITREIIGPFKGNPGTEHW